MVGFGIQMTALFAFLIASFDLRSDKGKGNSMIV